MHLYPHTNEKPFIFQICSRKISRKRSLDIELRTQSKRNPLVWEPCSRNFLVKIAYLIILIWCFIFMMYATKDFFKRVIKTLTCAFILRRSILCVRYTAENFLIRIVQIYICSYIQSRWLLCVQYVVENFLREVV